MGFVRDRSEIIVILRTGWCDIEMTVLQHTRVKTAPFSRRHNVRQCEQLAFAQTVVYLSKQRPKHFTHFLRTRSPATYVTCTRKLVTTRRSLQQENKRGHPHICGVVAVACCRIFRTDATTSSLKIVHRVFHSRRPLSASPLRWGKIVSSSQHIEEKPTHPYTHP